MFELAMWSVGLLLVIAVLALIIYFGTAIPEAYIDTRNAPRETMYWCHRHGHFRAGHCIPMVPGSNVLVCPTCYLESIKNAGKAQ